MSDWFWEGNVVSTVAAYLEAQGWSIERTANTETREAGVDILARKGSKVQLIEVKGYPSRVYQRGIHKGQHKPTNPSTQARHWYSEALLSAILRQEEYPSAAVAVAFPEFQVFTNLVRRTHHALAKLGIGVYIVKEDGAVSLVAPASQPLSDFGT